MSAKATTWVLAVLLATSLATNFLGYRFIQALQWGDHLEARSEIMEGRIALRVLEALEQDDMEVARRFLLSRAFVVTYRMISASETHLEGQLQRVDEVIVGLTSYCSRNREVCRQPDYSVSVERLDSWIEARRLEVPTD